MLDNKPSSDGIAPSANEEKKRLGTYNQALPSQAKNDTEHTKVIWGKCNVIDTRKVSKLRRNRSSQFIVIQEQLLELHEIAQICRYCALNIAGETEPGH